MKKIICPKCGSEDICKEGKPNGKQQYQYKKCRRKFITYSEEFKREAIQIFYEENSGRAVGRLIEINEFTVYNRIRALNRPLFSLERGLL